MLRSMSPGWERSEMSRYGMWPCRTADAEDLVADRGALGDVSIAVASRVL